MRDAAFSRAEIATYYKARAPGVNQRGPEWRGPCPIHKGARESFAVNPETGAAFCHSQCGTGWDLIGFETALSHSDFRTAQAEVFRIIGREKPSSNGHHAHIVAEYDYRDENENVLFQVVRLEPKSFRQRRPDGQGTWILEH